MSITGWLGSLFGDAFFFVQRELGGILGDLFGSGGCFYLCYWEVLVWRLC